MAVQTVALPLKEHLGTMFLWVTERPTAEEMEETATWKDEIVGAQRLRVLGELSVGAHGNELHLEILAATSANDDASRHTSGCSRAGDLASGSGAVGGGPGERPLACSTHARAHR
jgi:hypothetical protein